MTFSWLKRYMPRSLYRRAALILILPVVTLQLVVSVVFIQRHFEGVSQQMTREAARQVSLVLAARGAPGTGEDARGTAEALAQALAIEMRAVAAIEVPERSWRRWYDFSGRAVMRTLAAALPEARRVVLPDDHLAQLYIADGDGGWTEVSLSRQRLSASNPHQLLVNMVVFGALMTLIAYIYLRNQLRPITRLASVAEAFGRGRHEVYRPAGAVEVRAAGNAFLDMRARIERQIEQRTLMLSGVSHDLRTPLTRMRLAVSMLDDAERIPLERDIEDMQRMLDEFLSFARGAAEGESEEVDPAQLVRELVADAQRGDARLELGLIEGEGQVLLRPQAIRRAVSNLVDNALRYGGRARVSMRLSERSLRIRVEDDGPGIPEAQREEALKPFTRLDAARNQNLGSGVGLGLSIAADIARAHGGVLRLSQSPDLGGLRADIVIAR